MHMAESFRVASVIACVAQKTEAAAAKVGDAASLQGVHSVLLVAEVGLRVPDSHGRQLQLLRSAR